MPGMCWCCGSNFPIRYSLSLQICCKSIEKCFSANRLGFKKNRKAGVGLLDKVRGAHQR